MPKVQKEGIPRRLVISSVNWHNSKLLEYIDYHLQPIVQEIPFYIKDANFFPRQLKVTTEVPENSYVTTLEVKPFYTSSCLQMFFKISFLRNFANFTGRHLCWSLQRRHFPVKFAKFLRTLFLQNTCDGCVWLYTSIPRSKGIIAVKYPMKTLPRK